MVVTTDVFDRSNEMRTWIAVATAVCNRTTTLVLQFQLVEEEMVDRQKTTLLLMKMLMLRDSKSFELLEVSGKEG